MCVPSPDGRLLDQYLVSVCKKVSHVGYGASVSVDVGAISLGQLPWLLHASFVC